MYNSGNDRNDNWTQQQIISFICIPHYENNDISFMTAYFTIYKWYFGKWKILHMCSCVLLMSIVTEKKESSG